MAIIARSYDVDLIFEKLEDKDVLGALEDGIAHLKENHWWLSAGTLLGLHRDKQFIEHDTDLDIGVLGNIAREDFEEEFDLVRTVDDDDYQLQTVFLHKRTRILFDILHYWEQGNNYEVRGQEGKLVRPKKLIDNLSFITYRESLYFAPGDKDKYLRLWYGNWKIPKKDSKTKWIK